MAYKDRHLRTERECEWCGTKFLAQNSRIKLGQGRFCSLRCANLFGAKEGKKTWGYENGKKFWDKTQERWVTHWKDENGKTHSTTYQRWWWEMNVGKIPDNMLVYFSDGNSANDDPSNFILISKEEMSTIRGINGTGVEKPSLAGSNSKWWRGGSSHDGYPTSFSKGLKKRVKIRDNFTCQCCYSQMESRFLDVHHIDRDVNHNTPDNLVTMCHSCHQGVHSRSSKTNPQIEHYKDILSQLGE